MEVPVESQLFDGMSEDEVGRLLEQTHERFLDGGETLIFDGSPDSVLYLLLDGGMVVGKTVQLPDDEGRDQLLAMLRAGDVAGEMALIDGEPSSAWVRANRATRVLAMTANALNRLLETDRELASKVYRNLALIISRRLRDTNERAARLLAVADSQREGAK